MDVLSDVLRVVHLSGAVFFTTDFSAPWALESPQPETAGLLGNAPSGVCLREYMQGVPVNRGGWIAALNDRRVGKALRLLHASPGRDWTVDELAREAGGIPPTWGRTQTVKTDRSRS